MVRRSTTDAHVSEMLTMFGEMWPQVAKIRDAVRRLSPGTRVYLLALGLGIYLSFAWAWPLSPHLRIPASTPTYVLVVFPLLVFAAADFQRTALWAKLGGLLWLPFYWAVRLVAWIFGGFIQMALRYGPRVLSILSSHRRHQVPSKAHSEEASAPPPAAPHADEAPPPPATASEKGDNTKSDRDLRELFHSSRPRTASQVAAFTTWALWIALWVTPAFTELSPTLAIVRLTVGLFLPLVVLGVLLAIEYAYRPFPFWR